MEQHLLERLLVHRLCIANTDLPYLIEINLTKMKKKKQHSDWFR